MVEGIEAEIEAAGFTENKALELLEAAFLVLAAPCDGASAQGSIRRRLYHFAPAILLHPAAAQAEDAALTRAMHVRVSVSVSPWCLLEGCVQRVRVRPGEQGGRSNDRLDTCQ